MAINFFNLQGSKTKTAKGQNDMLSENKPQIKKDRSAVLWDLYEAKESTLKDLDDHLKGKTDPKEIAMLNKCKAAINFAMAGYQQLINDDHLQKSEIDMKNEMARKDEEKKQKKSGGVNVDNILESLKSKIVESYHGIGFNCDVQVVKGERPALKITPEMPKGFEGRDPFKLSSEELTKAKEALEEQKSPLAKDKHPTVGDWTKGVKNDAMTKDLNPERSGRE